MPALREKRPAHNVRPSGRRRYWPSLELLEERCVLSAGSLDATFGPNHDGKVFTSLTSGTDGANTVLFQSGGKIVATGGANGDFALIRYDASGAVDPSFGEHQG